MILASMISVDRTALICDLAETYGVFDLRSLPPSTVAALSAGLRDNSRVYMKLRGDKVPRDELLLATIADGIAAVLWRFGVYKDRPQSIAEALLGKEKKPERKVRGFRTAEEFEAAMSKFK